MQSASYHGYYSEQEIGWTVVVVLVAGAGEEAHLTRATCCFRVWFWQQRHLRPRTAEINTSCLRLDALLLLYVKVDL